MATTVLSSFLEKNMSLLGTTLFENIKIRARYISDNLKLSEPFEEDISANDLAQAICEEMERLHDRLKYVCKRLSELERVEYFCKKLNDLEKVNG